MKIEYVVQNGENSLYNYLKLEMQNSYNNVYVFTKCMKESGINIIEETLLEDNTKLYVVTGVDKKNTNKGILEKLNEISKEVYVFDNNNELQFESNILILENKKVANVYMLSGEFSESSISSNFNVISKIIFDLNDSSDKKEYKLILSKLNEIKDLEGFNELTEEKIKELVDDKIIFSNKVYNHSVKSISELLGKKKEDSVKLDDIDINLNNSDIDFDLDEDVEDLSNEVEEVKIPKVKNDLDIEVIEDDVLEEEKLLNSYNFDDISIEDDEKLKVDSNFDENETLDINDLLFNDSDLELSQNVKISNEPEKVINKKIDLKNVTNYIFELPKFDKKDGNQIKIPNYIKDLIPLFFEMDNTKQVKVNDKIRKERKVLIEIVDVKNDTKYLDKEARVIHEKGKSNIAFLSDVFTEVKYEENDILRISKTSSEVYHFEFISKNLQESKVWEKMINQKFRNNERKYGFI